MKQAVALAAAVLLVLSVGSAAAASQHADMWHGDLAHADYPEASGKLILNYVPGQAAWMLNVTVEGLEPMTVYQVYYHTMDSSPNIEIGCFETDEDGRASYHDNGLSTDDIQPDGSDDYRFNIRLTTDGMDCTGASNSAQLTTVSGNDHAGSLDAVGSRRPAMPPGLN